MWRVDTFFKNHVLTYPTRIESDTRVRVRASKVTISAICLSLEFLFLLLLFIFIDYSYTQAKLSQTFFFEELSARHTIVGFDSYSCS